MGLLAVARSLWVFCLLFMLPQDANSTVVLESSSTKATSIYEGIEGAVNIAIHFETGDLYVTTDLNRIMRLQEGVTTSSYTTDIVAGKRTSATWKDGMGVAAEFNSPRDIVYDPLLSCFYIADADNHAIRRMTLGSFEVVTLAGNSVQSHKDGRRKKKQN
mmetsp:Transcript_12751/g.21202  ORF Transcript_12751/g.21202 Transcript_12751/m.21202 type:complete len:160 (-) Transcript_12751:405-884(-)